MNQELESVRTDFLTQATGAGLDAETAQADAEVWAAFARTAYRRFGIRPREFSDMVGLEIRQGREVAAGEGYSQNDAEARLSRDVASWSERVDRILRGGTTPQERVSVMTTPLVFRLVGADLLPVGMDAKKIVRILEEHHLSADLLKQIPKALADPIAIFESDASGRYRGLVAMLDLHDEDGSTIVAALHLDFSSERKGLKVNRLASAYGKGGVGGPDDRWFRTQVEKGNTRYVNKTKSSLWFGRAGIDFTGGANLESFLDWRVPTESDLVKLRSAMPGHYQQTRGQAAFPSGQSIVTLFESAGSG